MIQNIFLQRILKEVVYISLPVLRLELLRKQLPLSCLLFWIELFVPSVPVLFYMIFLS